MILIVILFAIAFIYLWKGSLRPKNFPPGPPHWPLVGSLPHLHPKPFVVFNQLAEQYGDISGFKVGNTNVVCISDYELLKEAFKKDELSSR